MLGGGQFDSIRCKSGTLHCVSEGEKFGVLTELFLKTQLFDTVLLAVNASVSKCHSAFNLTLKIKTTFFFRKFWNSLRESKT